MSSMYFKLELILLGFKMEEINKAQASGERAAMNHRFNTINHK